jgi:hypothetical protein
MIKGAQPSNIQELEKSILGLRDGFKLVPDQTQDGTFHVAETREHRKMRYAIMTECLKHRIPASDLIGTQGYNDLKKSSINIGSNIYGYDLRAPSLHLIPYLTPIRDSMPRVHHTQPGPSAHWKVIQPSTFSTGGFQADPWINEGQRAPLVTISALNKTATYATIGTDGSDTYEAQSGGEDFEDPLATAKFIALENLMVMEENALIGGNVTFKIGTANTPTGVASGTGSYSTECYCAVVALTYAGVVNQSSNPIATGIVPTKSITTPDSKVMQVNGGCGIASAIANCTPSSNVAITWTVVQQQGECGYAWYIGTTTGAGNMHLQGFTTVPSYVQTGAPTTTGQLLNAWTNTTDYSVNDGTTGGGANQVTAFDGFLSQICTAAGTPTSNLATTNSYWRSLQGATLTATGAGGVSEIDSVLLNQWTQFKSTCDLIHVNAQELQDITKKVLNAASAPLLRYEMTGAEGEQEYVLTGSGTIAFYFNPYLPGGGRKIPIVVHPTLPQGTILFQGKTIPPYFKKSSMANVAEVICRRDYYSVDWADVTREYQFGTYSEEVLALYFPPAFAILCGIGVG